MPNYTHPGSDILKNKLNLQDAESLKQAEADLVVAALTEIEIGLGPEQTFDADHLSGLHRHIFQEIYERSHSQ